MVRCLLLALPFLTPLAGHAQSYSPDEVSAFITADTDKDGNLTRTEFKVFVREMARVGQPTARQIRTFGAYGFAFRITDGNRDGVLSPEEMRNADTDHRAGRGPVKP